MATPPDMKRTLVKTSKASEIPYGPSTKAVLTVLSPSLILACNRLVSPVCALARKVK